MKKFYISAIFGTCLGSALSQTIFFGWDGRVLHWFVSWMLSLMVAIILAKIIFKNKQ